MTESHTLTPGDLVTYIDYHGRRRAARIDSVLSDDLVGVRFVDVDRESGGGFDYDSPSRYVRCDDQAEWNALVSEAKTRDLLAWRAYYCSAGQGCERFSDAACTSCKNYDADPRLVNTPSPTERG